MHGLGQGFDLFRSIYLSSDGYQQGKHNDGIANFVTSIVISCDQKIISVGRGHSAYVALNPNFAKSKYYMVLRSHMVLHGKKLL